MKFFGQIALVLCVVLLTSAASEKKSLESMSTNLYEYSIVSIDGNETPLSSFKGKKILFVNTASECGFTPQYKGLQELHEAYGEKVTLIGLPCNQFGKQEPGTEAEIKGFCEKNYGVSFLMTQKIDVKGDNQHPLYTWLTSKELNGVKNSSVKWNFQKYLVDENGALLDVFGSTTKPMDESILKHLK